MITDEDEIMASFEVTTLFVSLDPELSKESMTAHPIKQIHQDRNSHSHGSYQPLHNHILSV